MELNESGYDLDINLNFELTVNTNRLNIIDLFFELPNILRGLNVGYKIYKLIIQKFDYLTSDYGVKPEARNIWYKLMVDKDYFCYTSKICSGVINKNIKDERLKEILNEIKIKTKDIYKIQFDELIFDNFLKEKINLWKL